MFQAAVSGFPGGWRGGERRLHMRSALVPVEMLAEGSGRRRWKFLGLGSSV